MKRNYIGLACTGHDNAVAIVSSRGELVFAEATERYLQNKRAIASPPDDLIRIGRLVERYCEPDATELVVAKSWSEDAVDVIEAERTRVRKQLSELAAAEHAQTFTRFLSERLHGFDYTLALFADGIRSAGRNLVYQAQHHARHRRAVVSRAFDHHLTHAAAACFSSPFESAACAVIDGFGEGRGCAFYRYEGGRLTNIESPDGEMRWSLGAFYHYLTELCGFDPWKGEEWKVMGLAPYGKLDPRLHELMRRSIAVSGLGFIAPATSLSAQVTLQRYRRAEGSSPLEASDLAHTGQVVFCELMRELLEELHRRTGHDNLVLAGGCALNSSCNGKILAETSFRDLHVFSAPADDGNAIGAAWLAFDEDHPGAVREPTLLSPYLGSEISAENLEYVIRFSRCPNLTRVGAGIERRTAELLASGKIVGWVQGRAEFGPRALGNRSILADPRLEKMRDRVNDEVKFREEFRPLAPSILHEHGDDYFESYQCSPYMERTLVVRPEARARIPAVVHVDNTARLQTVKKEWNERYHRLISEFHRITGVPVLLNTSFNVMGKPIIHSVEDAVGVFWTSGLDALVIDDVLIEK